MRHETASMQRSFSADYGQARARFLAAAAAVQATLSSQPHPLRGPDGAPLAMDTAWVGPRQAREVLVLLSGVHGVEGFYGSAAQIEWLTRLREGARLPKGVAVLLVHAVNPHGFAWLRRVNEDNVDLNRNWVDFSRRRPVNIAYDELHAALCPPDWSPASQARTGAVLAAWAAAHGPAAYLQAVSGGQWSHPQGLFYGGMAPSWSRCRLAEVLRQDLGAARRVIVLDFHTGLGPHGQVQPIVHCPRPSPAFQRTRAWLGERATSLYGDGSVAAEIHGDGLSAIQALLRPAQVDAVSLECGVQPLPVVAQALRADAWLQAHGNPAGPDAESIRRQMKAAFHSDSEDWRAHAIASAMDIVSAALQGLRGRP